MREQIELKFFIGYPEPAGEDFRLEVIAAACRLCGGCYVPHGTGYWCEDGSAKGRDTFSAPPQREYTLCIVLTCEPHKVERVYQAMRAAIVEAVERHAIATNWVHVQQHAIVGRHFSVAAHQDAAA